MTDGTTGKYSSASYSDAYHTFPFLRVGDALVLINSLMGTGSVVIASNQADIASS